MVNLEHKQFKLRWKYVSANQWAYFGNSGDVTILCKNAFNSGKSEITFGKELTLLIF